LKAPGFNLCAYEVKTWFQAFDFKCKVYRYTTALAVSSMARGGKGKASVTPRVFPPGVVWLYKSNSVDP
jgi:hypothetical protein